MGTGVPTVNTAALHVYTVSAVRIKGVLGAAKMDTF